MITTKTNSVPSLSLQERLASRTVDSMREIVKDSFERLNALGAYKDPRIALRGGVWMAPDYIRLYRQTKLTQRDKEGLPPEKDMERIVFGYAPARYFERVLNPMGKVMPLRFISREGVSPSKALDAAIQGPLLVDCGAACQISMHKALRDVIGEELYDKKFNGNLIIGAMADADPLFIDFLKQTETVMREGKKVFQVRSGMWTGISNHPDYVRKHRFGSSGQFNLIYAGKGKYLGLGLPPEGLTREELVKYLVKEFNLSPLKDLGGLVSKNEYEAGMQLLEVLKIQALMKGKPLDPIVKDEITAKDLSGIMESDMTNEYDIEKIEKMVSQSRKEESKDGDSLSLVDLSISKTR